MKPKDIHVSLYQSGDDEVRVWCVSFTLKGSIKKDGKPNEALRKRMESAIAKFLESVDFPELK